MNATIHPLGSSLADSLRILGQRPYLLAGLLILFNALLVPYGGLVEDSQLYSGLVLNRIDPEFLRDDLFFRYGSQDKYTLFSPLMAPLVLALGNKSAFFLAYLISVALMLTALTRLVLKLWPGSPAAIVGLIYLAVILVPYGGFIPLHVIEPFLSARMPACAIALWAFTDLLDRRWMRGSVALVFAFAIHPLMTLPVLMISAIVFLARHLGARAVALITTLATAAFGALLATPSIATPLFGEYDAHWMELTRLSNCYMFPQEWFAWQWFWNLFALAGLAAAAWCSRGADADRSRVVAGAVMIGVAGFFGTYLFAQLPYSLLMKGQPYRWLWLPLALTPPTFCHLAWQAWTTGKAPARLAAIGLVLFLCVTTYHWLEALSLVFFLPVTFYAALIFAKDRSFADKLVGAVAGSVALGLLMWSAYREWLFVTHCTAIHSELTLTNLYHSFFANLGGSFLVPALLLVLAILGSRLVRARHVWAPAAAAVALQTAAFVWTTTDHYQSLDCQAGELQFVDAFLKEHKGEFTRPTSIYTNYGRLYQSWIEWGACSYYTCSQLSGFVFNRDTAIEGKRRGLLVAPFEAVSLLKGRWEVFPDGVKTKFEEWYETDIANAQPTEDDLLTLAQDRSIDFIVLFTTHFENLACAQHGNVSIYDCRALRESSTHLPAISDVGPQISDDSE